MSNAFATHDTGFHALATRVPDARRSRFLPDLFGRRHLLVAEACVYSFMQWLSPADYAGGYWHFLEQNGLPLYLAPAAPSNFRICCRTNGYEGELTADAAGIVATLFAFSHLAFEIGDDQLSESFHRLRDHAGRHGEAAKIFSAID